MKILKKILVVVWAILTLGLVIYSQQLHIANEHQQFLYDETVELLDDMASGFSEYYENMVLLRNDSLNVVDIDSLFENSFFLREYEKEMQKDKD